MCVWVQLTLNLPRPLLKWWDTRGFSLFLIDELALAYIASLYFETGVKYLVLLCYSHRIPPKTAQKGGKGRLPRALIFLGRVMQIDIMGNSIIAEIGNLKI